MAGRFALIVATDAYADPKLSRLRSPARDASALAEVLRDPEIGEFEVALAFNETDAVLRRRIATFFSDRRRDELLLLHFSCHGLKDDSGQLYFAAADTEVAHLDATAIPAEFVSRAMARSRSNNVLMLLDCCYSGAIARGLRFRAGDRVDVNDHLGGSGRAIITASNAMEYAFEGDELTGEGRPSVFTSAVVKALETGEADRDQDHWISVRELYDYVCDQVREITPNQRPNMLSHLEGELYVARSRWHAPATLPRELLDGLDNQFAAVREGAVAALAELLHGRDRGLADAARRRLESVAAADDSRRVSAAASTALAAATPTPPARAEAPAPPPPPADPLPAATTASSRPAAAVTPPPAPTSPATSPSPVGAPISPPTGSPAAAEPAGSPSRVGGRVDLARLEPWAPSTWLGAGALLVLLSVLLPWDYGANVIILIANSVDFRPAVIAVLLTMPVAVAALRWRRWGSYALVVLDSVTLGLLLSMLRRQAGEGSSAGVWVALVGVVLMLVAAVRIVLADPERPRARLLPAEGVGAAAGLYAVTTADIYDPGLTEIIALAVASVAVLVLLLPRPARLRPLVMMAAGLFVAAYLLRSDLGEPANRAALALLVMAVAGGVALRQRTPP